MSLDVITFKLLVRNLDVIDILVLEVVSYR